MQQKPAILDRKMQKEGETASNQEIMARAVQLDTNPVVGVVRETEGAVQARLVILPGSRLDPME